MTERLETVNERRERYAAEDERAGGQPPAWLRAGRAAREVHAASLEMRAWAVRRRLEQS